MAVGIDTVAALWVTARSAVAWPWFVPIGTLATFTVGSVLGRGGGKTAKG